MTTKNFHSSSHTILPLLFLHQQLSLLLLSNLHHTSSQFVTNLPPSCQQPFHHNHFLIHREYTNNSNTINKTNNPNNKSYKTN